MDAQNQNPQAIFQLLELAKAAGCTQDQMERFLKYKYVPLPWQLNLHAASRVADIPGGPTDIGVGGSRGPGKSHGIFAQMALDDCQRVNNLKGLFLRQTGIAAKESLEDLVFKVLSNRIPHEFAAGVVRFPKTGSKIVMGGFKDEKDIDKYIGIEYDLIGIEEINQLNERKVTMLKGSLRTTKDNWRARMYASFNPGGKGHAFVKKNFVTPRKLQREKLTRFIPATYRDNPFLKEEYVGYLLGLEGALGAAWREGDFDVMAGTFFQEWDDKIHVVPAFEIPKWWRRICCLDYGFSAQSALFWIALDPWGNFYVYRELYKSGLSFSNLADDFVSMTPPSENIEYIVADPSIWARKGEDRFSFSGAQIFQQRVKELLKKDVRMVQANNDRMNGWAAVREYLKPYYEADTLKAKLRIFPCCENLIRVMPDQVHDEHRPEDLDTDGEDHAPDSLRYGIMSKPGVSVEEKPSEAEDEKPIYSDIGV